MAKHKHTLTSKELADFRAVWARLEAHGSCDGWGGAECRRIIALWRDVGRTQALKDFIFKNANRTF